MKLLVVTPLYEPARKAGGGVVSCLATLLTAIAKLGISVTVYTTNSSGSELPLEVPLNEPVNLGGVNTFYFKSTFGSNSVFDSRDLSRKLRQTVCEFDAVYIAAWFMWIGIDAARTCRRMNVPMVAGIHGGFSVNSRKKSYFKKKLFRELFIRKALKGAGAVHLTSEAERTNAGTWLNNLPTFIVPNAVDPDKFYPCNDNLDDFRKKYNIPLDALVLISVGRPDWMKRVDLLIKALVKEKKWYLVVVGDHTSGKGPEWKQYAKDLRVANRVIWTGFLSGEQLISALSASDLFSLVSESENFGMAAIEAAMCGVPLMLSKEVGVWELLKDEHFVMKTDISAESIAGTMMIFEEMRNKSKIDKDHVRRVAINKFSPWVIANHFITEVRKLVPPDKNI